MKFYATVNLEVYALVEGDAVSIEGRFEDLEEAIKAAGWDLGRALKFELRGEHESK